MKNKNKNTNIPEAFVPIITYKNADTLKETILEENKFKSGVYRFVNLINGKSYVGSSVNLRKRFNFYYSGSSLLRTKTTSVIANALLKNGYSNFSLDILEYCDSSETIKREQHYLDLLKPEYNILPEAGSSLGHKHTEETLAKLRASCGLRPHDASPLLRRGGR
jgi:group I intron endonuclease